MPLQPSHKLAHYEILEPIGKGGMGEVYRARDGKLGRDVAIKVLPDEFAQDEQRLRRFQREAKVLASLNDPGIAAIYGVEESDGTHYLVLELVPGETLAEKIARGPVPFEEALNIAVKIAEALRQAHEQGIVHRDLKPANVKLTPDDKVKVLDFGLAKAFVEESRNSDPSQSPTITRDATRTGVILGTAAYMSPEQARGKPVDKRTDIWAFGCVLYEMLTGHPAFAGQTVSDVLAAVLTREPDWTNLPTGTPFLVGRLLRHCLERERVKRIPDIRVVPIELDDALTLPSPEHSSGISAAVPRRWFPWVLVGVMAAMSITLAILWPDAVEVPRRIRRFEIRPTSSEYSRQAVVSPDGTRLVYPSLTPEGTVLLVRRFDELGARTLAGTEGGEIPFFSPDGEWIGFRSGEQLKKVPVNGGAPVTLCALPVDSGSTPMSWNADGDIMFGGATSGLWRVSEAGGEPEPITTPDQAKGELDWHTPRFLPGGRAVLFTLHDQTREFRIEALSLATGQRTVLIEDAFDGRYVPTGHLLYGRENAVLAAPFDVVGLEITGPSVQLLENIDNLPISGAAAFSVGEDGTLVYVPAPSFDGRALVWINRDGSADPLSLEPRAYSDPRLSPQGDRIAVAVSDGNGQDIWVYDLSSGTGRRVTFEGRNLRPVWSPDGTRVAFGSNRGGKSDIYWKSADGGGTAELLLLSGLWTRPDSWSADGETLAFREEDATELPRIGLLRVTEQDGSPGVVLERRIEMTKRPSYASWANFSRDGRFIAYRESGEIHVRPYPQLDESRWQVSTDGGTYPVWARNGRELFYRSGNTIIAVPIVLAPNFQFGAPRELFRRDIASSLNFDGRRQGAPFDVALDGRFLIVAPSEDELAVRPFYVVENWFEELKARVPSEN